MWKLDCNIGVHLTDISDGCNQPGKVANGFVIPEQTHYDHGEKVEFACRDPFIVNGQSEIYCTKKNEWSHPTPTCIKQGNKET